jgi:cysteine-rich repeat protein
MLETVCGDGRREASEQCDDGNKTNGDGCSSVCRWEYCGNGTIDLNASNIAKEVCDDGNNASGDGCSSVCTTEPICGNGVREGAEQCDDGNVIAGDTCGSDCRIEAFCGDGKVDEGEQCDPAVSGGSACTDNCTLIIML